MADRVAPSNQYQMFLINGQVFVANLGSIFSCNYADCENLTECIGKCIATCDSHSIMQFNLPHNLRESFSNGPSLSMNRNESIEPKNVDGRGREFASQ